MDPAGRFLKYDPEKRLWDDIGKKAALTKIRQALREGASQLKNEMKADGITLDQSKQAPMKSAFDTEHRENLEKTEQSKAEFLSLREKLRRMSDVSISSSSSQEESVDEDFGGRLSSQLGNQTSPAKRSEHGAPEHKGREKNAPDLSAEKQTEKQSDNPDSSPESAGMLSLHEVNMLPGKKERSHQNPNVPNRVQKNSSSGDALQFRGYDHQPSFDGQSATLQSNIPKEAKAPPLFRGNSNSYSMPAQLNASQLLISNPFLQQLHATYTNAVATLVSATQNNTTVSNTPVSSVNSINLGQAPPNFLDSSGATLANQAHLWQSQPITNQMHTSVASLTPYNAQPELQIGNSDASYQQLVQLLAQQAQGYTLEHQQQLNHGSSTQDGTNISQPNFFDSSGTTNQMHISAASLTPHNVQPELQTGNSDASYQQLLQLLAQADAQAQGYTLEHQQQVDRDNSNEDGTKKMNT
jgi:hypothetical protein